MGAYVNSTQVQFDKSHISCGVWEAHHLPKQNANQTMFAMANAMYHKANPRPCAFILFSDIVVEEKSRGQRLAEEIANTENHGSLLETKEEVNPRTGNVIRVWVWHVNHDKMRKWYQEELANRIIENVHSTDYN